MLKSYTLTVLRVLVHILFILMPFNVARPRRWDNECYQSQIVAAQWKDNCPPYCVNITYTEDGTVSAYIKVLENVQVPIADFALSQLNAYGQRYTLLNFTSRLCDLKNNIDKVPVLNSVMQTLKSSNFSFQCPIPRGIQNLTDLHFDQRNPFLVLMYRQNSHFTVSGGMSKELPNKTRVRLNAFNITAKIIKRRCDRRQCSRVVCKRNRSTVKTPLA